MYEEFTNGGFDSKLASFRIRRWNRSTPDDSFEAQPKGLVIVSEQKLQTVIKNNCVTDAKSLYDQLQREATATKEPRVPMAVSEIKQSMIIAELEPWWIPHNKMLVDGFAKQFGESKLLPLIEMMKSGTVAITAVDDAMKIREE